VEKWGVQCWVIYAQQAPSRRSPLTPKEGWLSDDRQVLRFRPSRWEREVHQLEITTGELLPDQPHHSRLLGKTLRKAVEAQREQPRGGHQDSGGGEVAPPRTFTTCYIC
jgi:hypothetical protein